MNALHQYLLDSYRAEQRGERLPPMPGTRDLETLRALRSAAARPPRGRLGAAAPGVHPQPPPAPGSPRRSR